MNQKIMIFLKTPKGKLAAAIGFMILVWGGFLISMFSDAGTLLPTNSDFEQVRSSLRKQQSEYDQLSKKKKAEEALNKNLQERIRKSWVESELGSVEMNLREMVDSVAKKHEEITLSSLGSVRTTKLAGDLFFAELDLTFSGEYGKVAALILDLEKLDPKLSWKRAEFSMDFRRNPVQQQNSSGTTAVKKTNIVETAKTTDDQIRFNGTLRILCAETLPQEKKGAAEK